MLLHIALEAMSIAFCAGLIYGIFGGGSGIFLMPGFFYLLHNYPEAKGYEMQIAIATTAAVSAILGIIPTWVQAKKNHIDIAIIKRIFIGTLIGTVIAVSLLNVVPSAFLKKLFAIVVIFVAGWFWFYQQEKDTKKWQLEHRRNIVWTSFIGTIWFLLGIAVFMVPYLYKCGIELRRAVGTATLISAIFSAVAALLLMVVGTFFVGIKGSQFGYLNIPLFLMGIIPSSLAAYLGATISAHLPHRYFKKIFALLILAVGFLML